MSNFVEIGRSVTELRHLFEIHYGGRPPSGIPNNASYEVTFRKAVIFWLCARNFVIIGQSFPELQHFFEIHYGGRPPF
jgi:hypothetical protein